MQCVYCIGLLASGNCYLDNPKKSFSASVSSVNVTLGKYRPIKSPIFVVRRLTLFMNSYLAARKKCLYLIISGYFQCKILFPHVFNSGVCCTSPVKHKLHVWRCEWFLESHCHPVLVHSFMVCILVFSGVSLPDLCDSQWSVKTGVFLERRNPQLLSWKVLHVCSTLFLLPVHFYPCISKELCKYCLV